jgi:hypothetical protein
MGVPTGPPSKPPGKPPGSDFEDSGELTLPELERLEPSKLLQAPPKEEEEDTQLKEVPLEEKPPPEAVVHPSQEDHPELNYHEPTKPKIILTPERRRKLDAWGIFGAVIGVLALLSSPLFLDALTESPVANLTGPGVDVHLNIIPSSSEATGIWINGFRVPNEREIVVHVPYGGAYKLEVKRNGYEKFERDLVYAQAKKKEGGEEPCVEVQLVPSHPGLLNVNTTAVCAIEISDGVSFWQTKTPVQDFKLPKADYTVKFVDPNCPEKEFSIPVHEGSHSHIVWDFPLGMNRRQPAGN